MSQLFLTNSSIIVIKYTARIDTQEKVYCLGNESIIRSEVFYSHSVLQSQIQNQLFYVEIEGGNKDFKVAIQFQKPIMLRHKLSNKYLAYSTVIQDQENDSTVKLQLSDKECYFRFIPCFQYQTKISNRIKFQQDVYLATQLSSAKLGYVSVRQMDNPNHLRTILGLNYKEKLMLHCYAEIDEEETGYLFGQTVWLTHVDSQTFMTVVTNHKHSEVMFEPLNRQNSKQNTSGLWLIDSIKVEVGGCLHFSQHYYLKSLCTKKYLTLTPFLKIYKGEKVFEVVRDEKILEMLKGQREFKIFRGNGEYFLVKSERVFRLFKGEDGIKMEKIQFDLSKADKQYESLRGEKIVEITLEERPSIYSKFMFQSLKGEENKIKKRNYLIFKHVKTQTCMGTRRSKDREESQRFPMLVFDFFQDEDLFKIAQTSLQDEQTFRFIFSFKDEQKYISKQLQESPILSKRLIFQILNLQDNILRQFAKLLTRNTFIQVQQASLQFIGQFYMQIGEYRRRSKIELQFGQQIAKILKNVYEIMRWLCKDYKQNQQHFYMHMEVFIQDVFGNHGAEELIVQIMRNNYGLLCKLADPMSNLCGKNLIEAVLTKIGKYYHLRKKDEYWKKMLKIFQLLDVVLYFNQEVIDINQRLVATELFQNKLFDRLFFQIKATKQRIKIYHPIKDRWYQLDQVKQPILIVNIERIFKLFSEICEDRNFIGKVFVHEYLNKQEHNGVKIIITYLNIPISPQLSNNLYSLISNTYIDSSPRINRIKPLPVILFNIDGEEQEGIMQEEKSYRVGLLDKREKRGSRGPIQLSNILTSFEVRQPSLNDQQLDLYKQQLNQRLTSQSWTAQLLKSICILIRLQSYSNTQIQSIKKMLEEQLMEKSLDNNIIPYAMEILGELNTYCEEIQIQKVTAFLKHKFGEGKTKGLRQQDVPYFLPHSHSLKAPPRRLPPQQVLMQPEPVDPFRQDYNDCVSTLKQLYPSKQLKNHLFSMFINSQKYSFSIISSLFRQLIYYNFPKLKMMRILTRSIVITGQEVQTFEQLFQLYKKLNHLNCISEHWLYSKLEEPVEYRHFVDALVEFTNYMFEDYQLFKGRDRRFRKQAKLNINRQLLLQNLAVWEVVLQFLGANHYLLDQTNKTKLSNKQRHTFVECFQFLFYFCQTCLQNTKKITNNIDVIQKLRGSIEVGQTKLLNMLYQTDDILVRQLNISIVQTSICKIVKNVKNVNYDHCEYSPQCGQFLLNIAILKDKVNKRNIGLIQKIFEKEAVFKGLLFLEGRGQGLLALDTRYFKLQPIRVPFLYHKHIIKLMCIMIQNLEYLGTRIRNRLKNYISLEQLFHILGLPDIYSHSGILPALTFLFKKQLFVLLNLYLQKNDSLNKLYQSKGLQSMLDHFILIFLSRSIRHPLSAPNQKYFQPFLQPYTKQLNYDLQNMRDFYNKTVHPLLSKLYMIFDKISNSQNNIIYKKIVLLLEEIKPLELNQDHLLKHIRYGMDLIDLKWRNFVDADEDNSAQEKYSKKTILELLKHDVSMREVQKEREVFYEVLAQKEEQYFKVMGNFIKMASEEESFGMSQDSNLIFHQIIQQLAEYLFWTMSKGRQFKGLQGKVIVETLIGYIKRPSFEYSNQISRKTFYQILRIFVILLQNEESQELQKVFYDYFKSQISSYRFFACLNNALMQVFDRIEGQKVHEQINFALGQLSLCGQQKKCEIDKQALKFIKNLCRYSPFTDFFRDQPYTISIDFLQRIFNLFYIMIKRDQLSGVTITISVVDIVEPIVDCMLWMLNGCNETNQNYIIDTKFPIFLMEILKKESIKARENEANLAKRDILLQQVVSFYQSNGINIKDLLQQNIKFLDFKHSYLLNRFKYVMLRLLHQCTLANHRVLSKLKILLPIQLLKINLIWTYYDFKEDKLKYCQETVLREIEDWRVVVRREDIKGTFLMVGFYFYILIQNYKNEEKDSKDQDEGQTVQDQEKQKERVIKKFFSSIADKERKVQKLKVFQKQQFGKQMAKFYKDYYQAYKFYKSKTLTIEANIYDKLTKIYFPKIPLCDELTDKMQNKLVQQAERISHEQKIKSLMQFQDETYNNLNGEQLYFQDMEKRSIYLAKLIRFVKSQHDIFLIIWVVSVLVTVNYLLYDYLTPYHYFTDLIGHFLAPTHFLGGFMLILELISFFFGFVLLLNLILKKIPYLVQINRTRYDKQQKEKQKKGKDKDEGFENSFTMYLASNLARTISLDIYIMIFSFLTIVHPVFAGFELIYIIQRIPIGLQIIVAIKETAFSLLAATGLLVIGNLLYAMLIYVAFTSDIGYGGTCQNLYKCFLMVFDQSLKGDSGFLGYAQPDYTYNVFTTKLLCQIFYILFVKKVIFEIFSGTIIDKFSELRQKEEETEKDQKANCYICGLERFEIDFQLEGFEEHIKNTHNKLNYVYYLFFLRRKKKGGFGIEENYIWQMHEKEANDWIPDETSLIKEEKGKEDNDEEKGEDEAEYEKYFGRKMVQFKKLKQRMEVMSTQLKENNT